MNHLSVYFVSADVSQATEFVLYLSNNVYASSIITIYNEFRINYC